MNNCIILLVVFVIVTSYLFKYKWSDPSTQQLLYVFLGLLIIILFKYNSNNNEGFADNTTTTSNSVTSNSVTSNSVTSNNVTSNNVTSNSNSADKDPANWQKIENITADNFSGLKKIVSYLKGINETDVNKAETQKIVADLSNQFGAFDPAKLEYQLSQITTLLNNLQNVSSLTTTPDVKESSEENILESKSIKESQFLQDIEIKKLENELTELQKLYTNFKDKEAKKVYKKIPIYSSCVMEANGTTTKQPSQVDFEDESAVQTKLQMLTGVTEDPNATPIEKLIKAINQGGIDISLHSGQ